MRGMANAYGYRVSASNQSASSQQNPFNYKISSSDSSNLKYIPNYNPQPTTAKTQKDNSSDTSTGIKFCNVCKGTGREPFTWQANTKTLRYMQGNISGGMLTSLIAATAIVKDRGKCILILV